MQSFKKTDVSLQAWLFDSVTYELSWLLIADAQHSLFQKNQPSHDNETLFETVLEGTGEKF